MSVPQPVRCPRCGAFFPPGTAERFCMHCGAPLTDEATAAHAVITALPPPPRAVVRPQRSRGLWVWALVGVCLAFLVSGALLLLVRNQGSGGPHSKPLPLPAGAKSGM